MLELVRAFVGCPSSDVHILTLPNQILLAYAFADCVVLLDASNFKFVRALTFREVFPSARDTNESIKCVSIEPGMRLIAASLGQSIAFWSLSGVQKDVWRVHSSLVIADNNSVSAIDCKSGLLGVGSTNGISVFTLDLEDNFLIWTKKWHISSPPPSIVRFSPSLMHLATITPMDNSVRIYSTASGSLLQTLKHPRPVKDFIWRFSKSSSRDDLILYTVTVDATLRIFQPVLDTPHFLQLHASLSNDSVDSGHDIREMQQESDIFWLHKDTLADSFAATILQERKGDENASLKRLEEIHKDGWDFFIRVFHDNSIVVRAVANIDRRPPTLLDQFILLKTPPDAFHSYPRHLHVLKTPDSPLITFVTSPPLHIYQMDPLLFFDGNSDGMKLIGRGPDFNESETSKILRFVRTPEGKGLAIIRENFVEAWHIQKDSDMKCLGKWSTAKLVVVLDEGHRIAMYSESDGLASIMLHQGTCPSASMSLHVPTLISLFSLPSGKSNIIIGITPEFSIIRVLVPPFEVSPKGAFELSFIGPTSLPNEDPLSVVIPVDPMAWSDVENVNGREHDSLLSISQEGVLAFWIHENGGNSFWRCTGTVKTGKSNYRLSSCSSAKKTALVFSGDEGEELSIWDSKESEFASGLEYQCLFNEEPVNDLDWTSTPDFQSILAIGFSQHILLLCQQRMTYFEREPAWGILGRIEIGHMLTHHITDSIWLTGGILLVSAGHHMLQYGQCKSSPGSGNSDMNLFERVARMNGPLPDYHPQMILQCLLWGKLELVKDIIKKLYSYLHNQNNMKTRPWVNEPIERYLEDSYSPSPYSSRKNQYGALFDGVNYSQTDKEQEFSRDGVQKVINKLEVNELEQLSATELAHLTVLLQTTLEVDEQRRALDANGLRYLISMRSFYILNERASTPGSPDTEGTNSLPSLRSSTRARLRFRDIVWAFHSESQEILLSASTSACGGKMKWQDARALGVFMWLKSAESMKSQMEIIARNHYMLDDVRDPIACSLFYFVLGKVKLVHGLWKQASWHKEQPVMLKFLSNDFSQPRWRTAALKNAYALLAKQRFEYAAAFFILGGGVKDAINVCVKQLKDPQLAIALARVAEDDPEKPLFKNILTSVMIPYAFENGNRWLASWAFWLLNRRDLAVQILVLPLDTVAKSLESPLTKIGDPNYDDPSLALLFLQLKSKTLQTTKGTNEISGRTEFSFVLQTARVFCRMGCHSLALQLVKSWPFDRPTMQRRIPGASTEESDTVAPLPVHIHSPASVFLKHRRRSSILIDMEISSDPSTRATTPETPISKNEPPEGGKKEADASTLKTGLGSLMKSAKQDISVPEFDMNAFF